MISNNKRLAGFVAARISSHLPDMGLKEKFSGKVGP